MEKSIFTLEEVNNELIILKVNCNSPLEAVKNYVDMNIAYISLTRGEDHIFRTTRSDGSVWSSFEFGISGYTLISASTELLKNKVLSYLHDKHILIGYKGEELRNAEIYYNDNYGRWQLSMRTADGKSIIYASKTAVSAKEMIEECKVFVEADKWDFGKGRFVEEIWKADNPVFKIAETEKKAVLKDKNPKTKAKKSKEVEKD